MYLIHHGIVGQQWGVQNGPPYPLKDGDHSAAEKRAMKKEDKKKLKAAYEKAAYSSAASNELKRRNARDDRIARRGSHSMSDWHAIEANAARNRSIEKAADKQAAKDADELLKLTESFMFKYGSVPIKDFGIDYTKGGKLDLTDKQEARILNSKTTKGLMMGQLIAGPLGALVGGAIGAKKDADRLTEFERSLDSKVPKESKKTDEDKLVKLKSSELERIEERQIYNTNPGSTKTYNLNFMETIQNDPILSKGSDKALDKEYSKFKKDPDSYMQNFKSSDFAKEYLARPDVKAAAEKSRKYGYNSLTEKEKQLIDF